MEKLLESQILLQGLTYVEEQISGAYECQFPWAQIDRGFLELMTTAYKSRNENSFKIDTRRPTKSVHFERGNVDYKIRRIDRTLRKLKQQQPVNSSVVSKKYQVIQKQGQNNVIPSRCNLQNSPLRLPAVRNQRPQDAILERPSQSRIDNTEMSRSEKYSDQYSIGVEEKKKKTSSYRKHQLQTSSIVFRVLEKMPTVTPSMQNRVKPWHRDGRRAKSWTEQARQKIISRIQDKRSLMSRKLNNSSREKQLMRRHLRENNKFPVIGQKVMIQGRNQSKENELLPSRESRVHGTTARKLLTLKNEKKHLTIGEKYHRKRAFQPQFDLCNGRGLYCLRKQQLFL